MKVKTLPIVMILMVIVSGTGWGTALVNNSGSSGEDTLSFVILNLGPDGNPAAALDSGYLAVFKSGADDVIFSDSGIGTVMVGVDSVIIGGDVMYYFHRAAADIDGDGDPGVYAYQFTAVYADSAMRTPTVGTFQITGWELDDIGDSIGLAAARSAQALDSLHLIIDSLMAVLDTVQDGSNGINANLRAIHDDAAAAGALEDMLDGTGGVTVELGRLVISGANGTDGSLAIVNSSGPGCYCRATGGDGSDGVGLHISGNTHAVYLEAQQGSGLRAESNGSGYYSIELLGSGSIRGAIDTARFISPEAADTVAGRVLEDSLHYQGQSAGGGNGLYSRTVIACDSTLDQVIPGVRLAVRNLDQTALLALGTTDSRGQVGLNLDPDSILLIPIAPGYIFGAYDTVVVSGAGVDTVFADRFDPGTPDSPDLCRLYGFLYDLAGSPEGDAEIRAMLPAGSHRCGGGIITPFEILSVSDSTGYFYLDLIPSVRLEPDSTAYDISIRLGDGTVLRERVIVPDLDSWLLTW